MRQKLLDLIAKIMSDFPELTEDGENSVQNEYIQILLDVIREMDLKGIK